MALRVIVDLEALFFKLTDQRWRRNDSIVIAVLAFTAEHLLPCLDKATTIYAGPITITKELIANKASMHARRAPSHL
jgi:hypothetical protein